MWNIKAIALTVQHLLAWLKFQREGQNDRITEWQTGQKHSPPDLRFRGHKNQMKTQNKAAKAQSYEFTRENFTNMETSPLLTLTLTLHTLPLNRVGSLRCTLTWHGISIYNGHLRGPVTITTISERLAVDLSLPAFTTTCMSRLVFKHSNFCMRVHQRGGMFSLLYCVVV